MTNEEREHYEDAQQLVAEAKVHGTTELDFSELSWLTTLPPELAKLTSLRSLDVRDTQIANLTPLASPTALTALNVSGTQITNITPLANLTALTSLDCWGTGIADLTPVAKLTALTSLDVGMTQITDLTPLAMLTALTSLVVSDTKITSFAPLSNLRSLTSLRSESTRITDLTPLANLTALTFLAVHSAPITDLTPIANLPSLTGLDIGWTKINRLSLPEATLARLEYLRIHGCALTDIPREYCEHGEYGSVAREVHAYVRGLREQGSAVLNECKLIVLGNGRAGKTSAIKALQGDPFDPKEQSTHAIRFWTWTRSLAFAPGGPAEQARVNVWDFGGQDIYHQAHRLFLRTRAVFLVCWNPWEQTAALREDGDEPRALTYWLEQIHALHPDPRILVLRTHADCDAAELSTRGIAKVPDWRDTVPQEYRQLPSLALGAAAPDARTGAEIHAQLDAAFIAEMSVGSRAVPAGWAAVRKRLDALSAENEAAFRNNERPPHAVLSEQEFAALVEESLAPTVTARDPAEARSFLHDIGALFYDERLGGRVVLDQRWFIEGIYAVLRPSPFRQWLEEGGGTFTARELAPQWSRAGYAEGEEQAVLLEFMQACSQAAEIMRSKETVNGEAVYLAPALLPEYDEATVASWPEPSGQRTEFQGYAGPKLGADAAQAFIVAAAKQFLRSGRYWRWGAEITSAQAGATARVQWEPIDAWGYGGHIRITLWGVPERAAKLGGAIAEQLRRFLPNGAREISHGNPARRELSRKRSEAPEPLLAVADSRKAAQGRYLSFSLAGDSDGHAGIEAAPLALYEALIPKAEQRGWKAFFYKRSTDQPDVGRLLRHVGAGDYVVVFLSKKYLRSEYCMEELRRVYEAEPKGQFPPETARLFGFDGWRPGDYRGLIARILGFFGWRLRSFRGWMKLAEQWKAGLKAKQDEWAERHKKMFPDFEKVKGILEKEPAYGWFRLCLDEAQLAEFQRELENYAATDAPLHFSPAKASDHEWLAKWTAEISERLK